MTLSDEKITGLFEFLDRLAGLDPEDLPGHFTSANIETLRLACGVLKQGLELERILSERRFIGLVKELSETKEIWSERLQETLDLAAGEHGQGNLVQALWILNGFIRFCPSPYFIGKAQEVMREYEEE